MSDFKCKLTVPVAIVIFICAAWTLALNVGLTHARPDIIGYVKNSRYPVPEPVYLEVEKPVPVEQPVRTAEVTQPVYVEKEVPVPIEVPVALKDWDSPEQLFEFLKNDDTDQCIILTADSQGQISLNGQCEDYALQLRNRAMAIGRYLSIEVLNPVEYEKWYGQPVRGDRYHAICMARIGNEFWYIEPTNDKAWLALYLD
jgi:hypothetical protein